MKIKQSVGLFIFVSVIVGSCKNQPKNIENLMVDISEFKINDSILKDGDRVQILGSSGSLTKEHKIDFYNLVVVKSLETGDTVNVLLTNYFMADLNDPETIFITNSSVMGLAIESLDSPVNTVISKAKKYKKVLYDTEFIEIDVRGYPSITGNLGDYVITESKNK